MADRRLGGAARAAVGVVVALTLLGVLIGDSTVASLLTPVVLVVLVYAMSQTPLRYSIMGLMFLALTLENPGEQPAEGRWKSPFFNVGGILLNHMNTVDRSLGFTSWISFSGMDVCIVSLMLIAWSRRNNGSKLDSNGHLATPKPLVRLAQLSIVGMLWTWFTGMVRGGEFGISLWQLDRVMYLPLVFLVFHWGLRGPRDLGDLARVVVAAAVYRSLLALYIIKVADVMPVEGAPWVGLAYATSHHDSMLFAVGFVILTVMAIEGVQPWLKSLPLLAVIAIGIAANGRRMAWVLVGASLATWYLVSPDNPVKRRLRRIVLYSTPAAIGYVLAGWSSQAGSLFKPVRILRSVVDTQSDASSFWREMENYNLIATLRGNLFLGTGYGHGFNELVVLPEVSYPLERFIPHNSLLGLWCYGGLIGYTCLTLLWVAGVYFAVRVYNATSDRKHRTGAVVCISAVLVYFVQGWGDMGFGAWTGVFLAASGIAMAGKLAVANGQWGTKNRPADTPPSPAGSVGAVAA